MNTSHERITHGPEDAQNPMFLVNSEGDVVVPDDILELTEVPDSPVRLHEDVPVEDPHDIPVEEPPEEFPEHVQETQEHSQENAFDSEDKTTWSRNLREFYTILHIAIERADDKTRDWKHPFIGHNKVDAQYIDALDNLTDIEKSFLK